MRHLLALVCLVSLLLSATAAPTGAAPTANAPAAPLPLRVWLPQIASGPYLAQAAPIWLAAPTLGSTPQVALFRKQLRLDQPLAAATLKIIADTRYSVWLDGRWLGRGPARFSRLIREFDQLALGDLSAGSHTIAVLVQWAPSARRAESVFPYLQAELRGTQNQQPVVAAVTDQTWRALASDAWRTDAAPVHLWGLLGPTELLDLRRLPLDWAQPSFNAESWPAAVPQVGALVAPTPRSIPQLRDSAVPLQVRALGRIAAGQQLLELTTATPRFSFRLVTRRTIQLETLHVADERITDTLRLDNRPLLWASVPERLDVLRAAITLNPGTYTIQRSGGTWSLPLLLPADLAVDPPSAPGNHAGRRLLLGALDRQPVQAFVTSGTSELTIQVQQTPIYLTIELPRIVQGRLSAQVSGPPGSVIDIGWDERLDSQGVPRPYPGSGHPEWSQVDSWTLDGRSRTLTTLDTRTGRYLLIAVRGPGPVQIQGLRVEEEQFPLTRLGSFSSNDQQLNQIWEIGANTTALNMHDAYADPWRERGQWWGDAAVVDRVNSVVFGEDRLLARGARFMAAAIARDNGRPRAMAPQGDGDYLHDYTMLWVLSVQDYAQRTGDATLVTDTYPAVVRFLDYLASREQQTGLLELPSGGWWQNAYLDALARTERFGTSAAVNALYYATLQKAALLAASAGDQAHADQWAAKATRVRAAINAQLYNPQTQRYNATIVAGQIYPPTELTQAYVLAYGVPLPEQRQGVADALLALGSNVPARPTIEMLGLARAIEGLAEADRVADALTLIRRHYGWMASRGATSWWETFWSDQSYTSALSHGWGSTPTWFLSRYVLGVQTSGPTQWVARPALTLLSQAQGSVPVGHGTVAIGWSVTGCETRLTVRAASAGQLQLPAKLTISEGSAVLAGVRSAGINGELQQIALSAGEHQLTVRAAECVKERAS